MATAVGRAAEPKVGGSPVDGPRGGLRRRAQTGRRGARHARWPTSSPTPMPSPTRCGRLPASWPTPTTSRAPQRDRARASAGPRRALAAHGGRRARVPDRDPARARRPALSSRDRLYAEPSSSRAGSPSACSTGSCPTTPSAPGSSCAGPPARPATGSRSTASPIPSARASSSSRTAGPSSSSSSSRRRAGSAGSSARRSPRCRSSTAGAAARPRSPAHGLRPHRRADRRRRAGRPEGPRLGAPLAGPRRPGRAPRLRRAPGRAGRGRPTTATGPGSSATPWPSSPADDAAAIRARLDGIRRRPARHPPRRAAAPPPGSRRARRAAGPPPDRDRFPDPALDPGEARP